MLNFKTIDISDKDWISELLKYSDFMGCEYSFANNMAWRRLADTKITRYKNFYILCSFKNDDDIPFFTFPAGFGDYADVLNEMKKFSNSLNKPLKISSVTKDNLNVINDVFKGLAQVELDIDSSDYIYNASDLINLSGKKYHKKRNHLARFNEFNWSFSKLSEKDIDEAIFFCTKNYNYKNGYDELSSVVEQFAINTYFTHFEELGLLGGVIKIDDKIEAVSIGEQLNSNTICVHIEKANTKFQGIYVAINNEFAKAFAQNFKYINREEDMGVEGLRKAKRSYNPAFIHEKYIITLS